LAKISFIGIAKGLLPAFLPSPNRLLFKLSP